MTDFDLRIRRLADNDSGRFRVALLPHRCGQVDGESVDLPWAIVTQGLPVTPPDAPTRENPEYLWLPSAKAVLQIKSSSMNFWDGWKQSKFKVEFKDDEWRCALVQDSPFAGEISSFGGLLALLESDNRKIETAQIIFALRNTKEFIAGMINAFRFPGELSDFAAYGETERLVCLSHFVFDLQAPDAIRGKFGLLEDWEGSIASIAISAQENGDSALGTTENLEFANGSSSEPRFFVQPKDSSPDTLRIETRQDASGMFVRLRGKYPAGFEGDRSEFFLLLHRNEGPMALGNAPVVARAEYDVRGVIYDAGTVLHKPRWQIKDSLLPDQLTGRQLHYRLELCDGWGQVRGIAKFSTVRLRYDPPPTPEKAEVRLTFAVEAAEAGVLEVEATFPGLENQLAEIPGKDEFDEKMKSAFELRIYYQRRPLDECGFYGDDDDFGLLEGLREADVNFDADADATAEILPAEGHPLVENMRGRYDRDGLWPVPSDQLEAVTWSPAEQTDRDGTQKKSPVATVTGTFRRPSNEPDSVGHHFHVALARVKNPEAPEGRLSPCTHWIRLETQNKPVDVRVFQIEFFDAPRVHETARTWRLLKSQHFFVKAVPDSGKPPYLRLDDVAQRQLTPCPSPAYFDSAAFVVRMHLAYPAPGDLAAALETEPKDQPILAIGGMRVLVRDPLAANSTEPFRVAETIQPLPELVALYRPLQIEAGLELVSTPEVAGAPSTFRDVPIPPEGIDAARPWICLAPGGWIDTVRGELRVLARKLCATNQFRIRTLETETAQEAVSPTESELEARWTSWSREAGKTLRQGLLRQSHSEKASDWPVLGRLVSVMRELGLVIDLAARLDCTGNVWGALTNRVDVLPAEETLNVKLIAVDTADRHTMATVRLVALPWAQLDPAGAPTDQFNLLTQILSLPDDGVYRDLYRHAVESPRLLRYRDATRTPLNLTLPPTRVLSYHWAGLRDKWHHDLEFAVQVLDRYHRIRERLRDERAKGKVNDAALESDPHRNAQEVLRKVSGERIALRDLEIQLPATLLSPETVRRLTIPRAEEAPAVPGVFPTVGRPEHVLSFEVLEGAEMQAAAHNILARTRSGDLRIHTRLRSTFPYVNEFAAGGAMNTFIGNLKAQPGADSSEANFAAWKNYLGRAPSKLTFPHVNHARRTTKGEPLTWGGGDEFREADPPMRPGRIRQSWRHVPYFFAYEFTARCTADLMSGSPRSAQTSRAPARLGLPALPQWWVVGERLHIKLMPALLGSHLTEGEFLRATWEREWTVGGAAETLLRRKNDPTATYYELPHVLLPDLWLEYSFYVNTGEGMQEVLVPLFNWAADRAAGQLKPLTDTPETPLGFSLTPTLAGLAATDLVARWTSTPHGQAFEVRFDLPVVSPLDEVLKDGRDGSGRLQLLLRRGSTATDFLLIGKL